jgi:hypothetical protein
MCVQTSLDEPIMQHLMYVIVIDICIVQSIEFVIRVGAGTVNASLILNYRDKRHIYCQL